VECSAAVTLGTGLGFGVVKDAAVLDNGKGGPPVSIFSRPYKNGILEDAVSARGISARYQCLSGVLAAPREIAERAAKGDAHAVEVFRETGEILAAVLYSEEEESERLQWYETTVPLECAADCDAAGENCIFKISAVPLSAELEIKPDYDGEERILVLELSVSVDVRVWREEEMELLTDLYSLREKAVPVVRERIGERLLVKNAAKCRVTEQLEIPESQEKILQICACEGTVRLEKYEPVENGIRAEGTITAELLYITTDDNMPIQSAREIYPFSQILEIPDMQPDVEAEMDCGLEQLSAVMMDQEHIEIKAVIQLNLMAFLPQKIQNISVRPVNQPW
jgi:hypothetical protein